MLQRKRINSSCCCRALTQMAQKAETSFDEFTTKVHRRSERHKEPLCWTSNRIPLAHSRRSNWSVCAVCNDLFRFFGRRCECHSPPESTVSFAATQCTAHTLMVLVRMDDFSDTFVDCEWFSLFLLTTTC